MVSDRQFRGQRAASCNRNVLSGGGNGSGGRQLGLWDVGFDAAISEAHRSHGTQTPHQRT
jgi:hypothetical protein